MITLSEIRNSGPFGELAAAACAELRFRQAAEWQTGVLRDEVAVEWASCGRTIGDGAAAVVAALSLNGEGGTANLGAWVEGSVPSTRFLTFTPGSGRRHASDGQFLTAVLETAAGKLAPNKTITVKVITPVAASIIVDDEGYPNRTPSEHGILSPKEGAPTWWRQLLRLAATARGLQDAGLKPTSCPGKTAVVSVDGHSLLAADISPLVDTKIRICLDPEANPTLILEAIS